MGEKIPIREESLPTRTIEGEVFTITPQDNRLHNLNEVGTRIYGLVDGKRTLQDLTTIILDEYDVEEPTARADCAAFLDELERLGLIRYIEEEP